MLRWFKLTLCAAVLLLAGCTKFFEVFVSDSATRLAYQMRDEAAALRRSGKTKHVFIHQPRAWPDGLTGDYRIEIISSAPAGDGRRAIFTAKSYAGPRWSSTTRHLNFVAVPNNLPVVRCDNFSGSGDAVCLVAPARPVRF